MACRASMASLVTPRAAWGFAEIARRSGDFAVAGVIAHVRRRPGSEVRCDFARLVGFGVGDRPVRFRAAEDLLMSDDPGLSIARVASAVTCDPPDDVHASADYRRHLASILTGDVLGHALKRTRGPRRS